MRSQVILSNSECFEPRTTNLYTRRVLAGDYVVVNKYLQNLDDSFIDVSNYVVSSDICQSCHKIHTCPECNLSYTYHKDGVFRCHRCDRGDNLTHTCRHCKKPRLNFGGIGTQKVEVELLKLFPGITICRLDKDTNKSVKDLEKTLETFENEGDILIGTQMIAKGHHFEGVTLVGVLGIDSSLNLADFRAGERTYQLLSQVAGRAGRGNEKRACDYPNK